MNSEKNFRFYEYKEIAVPETKASFYLDCYQSFGWQRDDSVLSRAGKGKVLLKLKRDRSLLNRVELTRLQRHFEANMDELAALERSKTTSADLWTILTGMLGTAFMAGATFAAVADPPIVWLCILLAIPGFLGWIAPRFVYRAAKEKQTRKVQPFIEAKTDEIYQLCKKGYLLL